MINTTNLSVEACQLQDAVPLRKERPLLGRGDPEPVVVADGPHT